ncbi:MAG: acyl-CoA dehydrogenase [Planctomycetota bacterium]|nr:acyl-CoA dehydrogenase [Planctomycetota bacterium]
MQALLWIACATALLALFVVLAWFRRPLWGALLALAGAVVAFDGGAFATWSFGVPLALLALVAAVALVTPLRRALVTGPLFPLIRRILPVMSDTEKAALDAGTVGWDGELFGGSPDFSKLVAAPLRDLDERERKFLDEVLDPLCASLDDHKVTRAGDLPPEAWERIRTSGLMGMIIPRSFGGLEFSARMQSTVVARLSSRCVTAAVTVMVPNSLGPAELLLHYGTDEQKRHWLPRLARGEEIPCFALTEPYAGSDAASMRSVGVVAKGQFEGREVLGMRLTWDKRYITLAPIATVLGLAFKLRDPERLLGGEVELGITCALIPAKTPGVETGLRHDPLGVPFMNGPTRGHDVFVPLEFIIGGPKMAGRGWVMLMQCLAAGRGVSLPALSTGAAALATRVVGAHASVREQFGLPLGRFEGLEARLGRIGGLTYTIDAARVLTLGALDRGEKPAVTTAIMKAYTTEAMRVVITDAMDIVGGGGICRGPRNTLAHAYQSLPIGITVEGANILTRSMIIFGQGAIRCHPWVQRELAAADARDVKAFDEAFWGHVGHVFINASRALVLGLSGGNFADSPVSGPAAPYFQQLARYSAAFAFTADTAMGTLGANLKRKENLSGRLADALAWMYLASAVLRRFVDEGQPKERLDVFRWSMENALYEIEHALAGFLDNLPLRWVAFGLRPVLFPTGARRRAPSDRRTSAVARELLDGGELREKLGALAFVPRADEPGLGFLEATLVAVVRARPAREKLKEAQRRKALPRGSVPEVLEAALAQGVIDGREAEALRAAERARDEAAQVDSFPGAELTGAG